MCITFAFDRYLGLSTIQIQLCHLYVPCSVPFHLYHLPISCSLIIIHSVSSNVCHSIIEKFGIVGLQCHLTFFIFIAFSFNLQKQQEMILNCTKIAKKNPLCIGQWSDSTPFEILFLLKIVRLKIDLALFLFSNVN